MFNLILLLFMGCPANLTHANNQEKPETMKDKDTIVMTKLQGLGNSQTAGDEKSCLRFV